MFYLGVHQPQWLATARVPLFVSRRRFAGRKTFPKAASRWALDSGAFTEIKDHGRWTVSPQAYADEVRAIAAGVGRMDWAAIQDWMCEPPMLKKTGLTVKDHQARTVESYITLKAIAPDMPWTPVLQGWAKDEYLDCVEQYAAAGVDLRALPLVGLGSVCRRQATGEFVAIVRALSCGLGLNLHGFGVKTLGLQQVADLLVSSDSMAWSVDARWKAAPGLDECVGKGHKNCANCLPYALDWRRRLLAKLPPRWSGELLEWQPAVLVDLWQGVTASRT